MNRIRIERIRGATKVGEYPSARLPQPLMRRAEEYVGKRLVRMDVEGKRRKGRPKQKWVDSVNVNLRVKGLSGRRHKTWLYGGQIHRLHVVENKK